MKLAVVRVRGDFDIKNDVRATLQMLNLKKKNHCTVVEDSVCVLGMLKRVSFCVTWGPVDEKTLALLKKKGDKVMTLHPPRKGYGRKGVKVAFSRGGAVGNRKEKINDLVTRMM